MAGRHGRRGRVRLTLVAGVIVSVIAIALVVKVFQTATTDNRSGSQALNGGPSGPETSSAATLAATGSPGAATPGVSTAPSAAVVRVSVTPAAMRLEGDPADVNAQVAALTAAIGPTGVSIAALNVTTGASYTYGASGGMNTGSVVKLDILETLLLQRQDAQTQLTSTEISEATHMIENSDNNAAQYLWVDIGSDPAVTIANKRLGPVHTVAGTNDYWGLTTTDGADQVALLKNLVEANGPLDAASQSFALNLMRNVEGDQRWGVGVIADPGTTFANKNGWLAVDDDNDLWLVNSDGIVTVQGQPVLISVLTQHDPNESAGITLVQQLAEAIAPAV